jgi:hypothetical protein
MLAGSQAEGRELWYLCQQDDDHPNAGVQALSLGRRPALRGFAFPSTTIGDFEGKVTSAPMTLVRNKSASLLDDLELE